MTFKPVAFSAAALFLTIASAQAEPLKVTLLGTGTPTPRLGAFSASTLVEAGKQTLLFDLGRGSTIRLFQKRIPLGAINAHFITHMHSDHLVGLPDMWLSGWIQTPWGSRKTPMVLFGPKGTVAMTENLTKAFSEDIRIRIDDEHFSPDGAAFAAKDIVAGPVYEKDGVKVTAIDVNHGPKIKPSPFIRTSSSPPSRHSKIFRTAISSRARARAIPARSSSAATSILSPSTMAW